MEFTEKHGNMKPYASDPARFFVARYKYIPVRSTVASLLLTATKNRAGSLTYLVDINKLIFRILRWLKEINPYKPYAETNPVGG